MVSSSSTQGNTLCPGAIWESILQQIAPGNDSSVLEDGFLGSEKAIDGFLWSLPGPGGDNIVGNLGSCPSNRTSLQICALVEPLIVAQAAFNNSDLWESKEGYMSYNDILHFISKSLYTANSAVQYLHNTIGGPENLTTIRFPNLFRTKEQYSHGTKALPLNNLTKADIYTSANNISEYYVTWTDLRAEPFGDYVSGFVLVKPRDTSISPQNISTCSVSVGWGTSTMAEDLYNGLDISPSDIPGPLTHLLNSDLGALTLGFSLYRPIFANESGSAYPQRPVQLAVDWLEFLNPITELADGTNITVINAYMSLFSDRLPEYSLAQLLTHMLDGGLAVIGSDLAWQGRTVIDPVHRF